MAVETKQANYSIPIPKTTLITLTGTEFVQTHEIPITVREETWPLHTFYVCFKIPPVELVAGGGDIETASQRIRAQMIHHFEMDSKAIKKLDPPPNAKNSLKIISQYFCLKT